MKPLDFSDLDDISLSPSPEQVPVRFLDSGPLLEYFFTICRGDPSKLFACQGPPCSGIKALARALGGQSAPPASTSPRNTEFALIGTLATPLWIAFCTRVQNASLAAGFGPDSARLITAALYEMVDNVREHSERPDTGIAGYMWEKGRVSYSVADAGVGILDSLTQCADYRHLTDHGDALRVAMTEGESRHGRGHNRGYGFKQLLQCLGTFGGEGRFRSGDSGLLWHRSTTSLDSAEIVQRIMYTGFMVHIDCRCAG